MADLLHFDLKFALETDVLWWRFYYKIEANRSEKEVPRVTFPFLKKLVVITNISEKCLNFLSPSLFTLCWQCHRFLSKMYGRWRTQQLSWWRQLQVAVDIPGQNQRIVSRNDIYEKNDNLGFLELIATIREINNGESFSLLQEGVAGTADALIASGMNAMVDSVTNVKNLKEFS